MTVIHRAALAFLAILAIGATAETAIAQDLYDTEVLRTFDFTFHDSDWLQLLRDNYQSETPILADLEVDGEQYPSVGVRIRGNTSYRRLPTGSQKFSLKIYMDFVDSDQDLMGYNNINLNNGFRDPTFCREVAYNNYVAQFIPHPRANHAVVTLNGENWGVYINTQQPDKSMLRQHFTDEDGLRIKCANSPNGPGLRYFGPDRSLYSAYEIQDDGGLDDPLGALIAVCDSVTNEPLDTWENIDTLFAIDPSIWSVVLENLLTDDDSYVNKGCDFMAYRDPIDGRMHLLQRDANEAFTEPDWSVTRNFNSSNKPVLYHVLDVPELRQRFMAHYRATKENLNWEYFEPIFSAHRTLIDAAVQADTKKLYSYQLFLDNFTETVIMPYQGLPGGPIVGLQEFVEERGLLLDGTSELVAAGPTINSVEASDYAPDPLDPVVITATVTPNGSPVATVELFFRPDPADRYERVAMGAKGNGVYDVVLPIFASPGQRVAFYVGATSSNQYASSSFSPARSEVAPLHIEYTFGSVGGMRITEWMYSGDSGEFIEFTNISKSAVDMAGWSFDDNHREPGAFDIGGFGIVQPSESVVLTESVAADFRTAWGLGSEVGVIGELGVAAGHNISRNDELNLYDDAGELVDRLLYGDEDSPGTIRTRDASGQTCRDYIGQNDVFGWELSTPGDKYGSFEATTGEAGTPGAYNAPSCCAPFDLDCDGDVDLDDFQAFSLCMDGPGSPPTETCPDGTNADFDGDEDVDCADFAQLQEAHTGPNP